MKTNQSPVRSSLFGKITSARRVLSDNGFGGLLSTVCGYLKYHLHSKWRFVYFSLALEQPIRPFNLRDPLVVRIATPKDRDRIESEIFPLLTGELRYEQRYFERLGDEGMLCFLAEKDGRLIHYSWVFTDVFKSILMDVPVDKTKLNNDDAFIGPVFTDPSVRGFWVYPYVLTTAVQYLRDKGLARRVIVFVAGGNPASVSFYNWLGFKEMADVVSAHPLRFPLRRLRA